MKALLSAACAAFALVLVQSAAFAADKPADKAPSKVEKALDKTNEVIDDSAITGKVKALNAKDKTVSALKINVDTDKGVVRLSGNAKSREEAAKAVEIAKSVNGVTSVKNDIAVGAKK
jgi:hyperosmotically inducible periplasmic protein